MIPLLLALLQAPGAPVCQAVEEERILGRHLSAAVPALAGLPADLVIGYAPAPGVTRVFAADQLQRLARAHGINAGPLQSACFEWRLTAPDEKEVLGAMRRSLGESPARIEILEMSRRPAPRGELVFPMAGLQPAVANGRKGRIWRGSVLYGNRRKFPTWARVSISTTQPRVVAAEKLSAGTVIRAEQVRLVTDETSLLQPQAAYSVEEVAGKVLRRSVQPGDTILRHLIQAPAEITKGQTVHVEAKEGGVRFTLEAKAESNGRRGEMVLVRNPSSGKSFRARVEGPGKATVGGTPQ